MTTTTKELLDLIPPFTAPATIWVEKIKLLLPTGGIDQQLVINVIKSRLPTEIFSEISSAAFKDLASLLDKIVALEATPKAQAIACLFAPKNINSDNKKPSKIFEDHLKLVNAAFPTLSKDHATEIAWEKTSLTLDPQVKQLLLVAQGSLSHKEKLELANEIWSLRKTSHEGEVSHVKEEANKIFDVKIASLEASINEMKSLIRKPVDRFDSNPAPPTSANLCFYHRKFGHQARRCVPPCRYFRNHPKFNRAAAP